MIFTFYSYKGGVGRSMALANIAELFYQSGYRVLMIDWDLEAPGLEHFFPDASSKLADCHGVMDMILHYKDLMREDWATSQEFFNALKEPQKYIHPIYELQSGAGELAIMTAGQRSGAAFARYAEAVVKFDWSDFYENWEGERYFAWLSDCLRELADIILIDSRTGVTEMGGVCTYHLADAVVLFCGTNQQNINGTLRMAKNFSKPELTKMRLGRPLDVVVVPARVEYDDSKLVDEYQQLFKDMFVEFVPSDQKPDDSLWELSIPYRPKYAFAETIAVRESTASDADIARAYRKLQRYLWSLWAKRQDGNDVIMHTKQALKRLGPNPKHSYIDDFRTVLQDRLSLTESAEAQKLLQRLGAQSFLREPQGYEFDRSLSPMRGELTTIVKADDENGRAVAIMLPYIDQGQDIVLRFTREVNRHRAYNHPHIVSFIDYNETFNPPYFVIEWLDGEVLELYLRKRQPSISQILTIFKQIVDALAYIHSLGDVHRNITPQNIMVLHEAVIGAGVLVKLLDFGIVLSKNPDTRTTQLTAKSLNMRLGTPHYMAPEQFANPSIVDARADLYSLGVMLYEAVTGRLPFTGDDVLDLERAHLKEPTIPPSRITALVTPELDKLILKLLEKDPNRRFASASEFLLKLQEIEQDPSVPQDIQIDKYQPLLLVSPLQERKAELGVLKDACKNINQTPNKFLLLNSPTGFGKTRLLDEYRRWLSRQDVICLNTKVTFGGQSSPFGPFIEIVRQAVQQIMLLQPSEYPKVGPLVALIPNDLPTELLGPFSPDAHLPEQIRSLMFDATAELITALATIKPVVIIIDDLHQADPDTLELIEFLSGSLPQKQTALLFCVAACSEEPLSQEWKQLRSTLISRQIVHVLDLSYLSAADTEAMITGMLGHSLPELAAEVYNKTQGNPFAVESIIRSLTDQEMLVRQGGAWTWVQQEITLPQNLQETVKIRLQNLSEEEYAFMQMAAVIGMQFDFNLLIDISGEGEDRLIDTVHKWQRMQEVTETEEDLFTFKHKIVLEYCLQDLPTRKHKRLHLKTAKAIESRYQNDLDSHAEALALHYRKAEKPVDALAYAVQASRYAYEQSAYLKTAQLLEQYKQLITKEMELQMQVDLYDLTGDTQARLGDHEKALASYLVAYAVCEQASLDDIHTYQRISVARKIGREYGWQGEMDKAVEWMQIGRNIVEKSSSAKEREELALLEIHLGFIEYQQANYPEAERNCLHGISMLQQGDDQAVRAEGLLLLGAAQDAQGKYSLAQQAYETSVFIWQNLNNPYEIYRIENNLAGLQLLLGQLEKSESLLNRVIKFFEEIGDSNRLATALTNLGLVNLRQGRYTLAKESHIRAMQLADDHKIHWLRSLTRVNLAWVYLTDRVPDAASGDAKREELFRAKIQAEESIAIEQEHKLGQSISEARRILAHIAIEQLDYEAAIGFATIALNLSSESGDILEEGAAKRSIGRVLRKKSNFNEAKVNLFESLAILEDANNPYEIGLTHQQIAWFFAATEEEQEAFAHVLKAMLLLERAAPIEAERMRDDERAKTELSQPVDTCLEIVTQITSEFEWSHFSTMDLDSNTKVTRFRFDKRPESVDDKEYEIALRLIWSPEHNSTTIEFAE